MRIVRVLAAFVVATSVAALAPVRAVVDARSRPELSSGELRVAVAAQREGKPVRARTRDGRAVVEVYASRGADVRAQVERVGGVVTGEVRGVLVQADVPWSRLSELERSAGVDHVQAPARVNVPLGDQTNRARDKKRQRGPVIGEEIEKIRAAAWHAAGHTGAGVKVGIIDVEWGGYEEAVRRGEVSPLAGSVCMNIGVPCDLATEAPPGSHGTAVAEIVHEVAPGAELYRGWGFTAADLQFVVDAFAALGVQIITRSYSTAYDGPGDGRGAVDAVVDDAIAKGMTWFNSAGNAASKGLPFPRSGRYYRGVFTDTDGNGLHEFAPGDERMAVPCTFFSLGLRWDDFDDPPGSASDYDLYAVGTKGNIIGSSQNRQSSTGGTAPPIENFPGERLQCSKRHPGRQAFLEIKRHSAGTDTSDTLEFGNNGANMEYSSNPFSAGQPVCDSKNPGSVCVGAIDPPLGTTIAFYSSQGPTNDGRIKPDVSAAACVDSTSYRSCFNGTSAATPVAAAAAALLLGAGIGAQTPAALGNAIRAAVVDRGAIGPDPVYGTGELELPAPPSPLGT